MNIFIALSLPFLVVAVDFCIYYFDSMIKIADRSEDSLKQIEREYLETVTSLVSQNRDLELRIEVLEAKEKT